MKIFIDKYSDIEIGYSTTHGGELTIDIPDSELLSVIEAIEQMVAPKDRPALYQARLGELHEVIRLLNGND